MLILTGQRRLETSVVRWIDLDLEAGTWDIPAEYNKQERAHRVPLSDQTADLLQSLPRFSNNPNAFVFTTTSGTKPINGMSKAKARLDKLLAKAASCGEAIAVQPWRLHDVRRTVASGMARLGVPPHVCEKVLGHEQAIRGMQRSITDSITAARSAARSNRGRTTSRRLRTPATKYSRWRDGHNRAQAAPGQYPPRPGAGGRRPAYSVLEFKADRMWRGPLVAYSQPGRTNG
jgi:hypothetical protein